MRPRIRILQVSILLALLLALVGAPTHAVTRVKSGSGYGPNANGQDPTNAAGVSACATTTTSADPEPCEAFMQLSSTALGLREFQFSDGENTDAGDIFYVFDLGAISNQTISVAGMTLGLFACGNSGFGAVNYAFDSGGPSNSNLTNPDGVVNNPATNLPWAPGDGPGLACSPVSDDGTQTDANGNPFVYTLANGRIDFGNTSGDEIVVYELPATTPEPGSIGLLAIGVVALVGWLAVRNN
jgi:hypothetical protein